MRYLLLITILSLTTSQLVAQKYLTRNGHISFFSEAPLENIEAHNRQASSILDVATGEIAFTLLIKGFAFEKALMQEHFNEKYMESDQYPKATFEGSITNIADVDLTQAGEHIVNVKGNLTIHGVTKEVTSPAIITNEDGKLVASAKFPVALADYEVEIPSVVADNIAEIVEVAVDVAYQPYTGKK